MFLHRRNRRVNQESESIPGRSILDEKAYLELHGPSPKIFNLAFNSVYEIGLQEGQRANHQL